MEDIIGQYDESMSTAEIARRTKRAIEMVEGPAEKSKYEKNTTQVQFMMGETGFLVWEILNYIKVKIGSILGKLAYIIRPICGVNYRIASLSMIPVVTITASFVFGEMYISAISSSFIMALVLKSMVGGVARGVGAYINQSVRGEPIDIVKICRWTIVGLVYIGPITYGLWFSILSTYVGSNLLKVVIDLTLYTIIVALPMNFIIQKYFIERDAGKIRLRETLKQFARIYIYNTIYWGGGLYAGWTFWPEHIVLISANMMVLWSGILIYLLDSWSKGGRPEISVAQSSEHEASKVRAKAGRPGGIQKPRITKYDITNTGNATAVIIGAPLPKDTIYALESMQDNLKKILPNGEIYFITPETLHISVETISHTSDPPLSDVQRTKLSALVKSLSERTEPFKIGIKEIRLNDDGAIIAECCNDTNEIQKIRDEIGENFVIHPKNMIHITLGYVIKPLQSEEVSRLRNAISAPRLEEAGQFTAGELSIVFDTGQIFSRSANKNKVEVYHFNNGVTATINDESRYILERYYGIKNIDSVRELDGGEASQFKPILVEYREGEKEASAVLRRLDQHKSLKRHIFSISVMEKLYQSGIPVPKVFEKLWASSGVEGRYVVEHNSVFYILEEYIERGIAVQYKDAEPRELESLVALAARVNNALNGFVPEGEGQYKSREQIFYEIWPKLKDYYEKLLPKKFEDMTKEEKLFIDSYGFFEDQARMFTKRYTGNLRDKCVVSPIHNDINCGNVRFDGNGDIVSLFDFGFTQQDYRIVEFINMIFFDLIINKYYAGMPNYHEKLATVIEAYQKNASQKLNRQEIYGIIEILRMRFFEELYSRFLRHYPDRKVNIFEHPEMARYIQTDIEEFKKFAVDFSSAEVIEKFADRFMSSEAESKGEDAPSKYFVNNERTKFIESANELIDAIEIKPGTGSVSGIVPMDKNISTTEIARRADKAVEIIEGPGGNGLPRQFKTKASSLGKSIDRFRSDGLVGALIVLARKAQRDGQKLIIGLETGNLPGINEHVPDPEYAALQLLLQQIRGMGGELRRLGLNNLEIVCASGDLLAQSIKAKIGGLRESTGVETNLSNVVVFASRQTIDLTAFNSFRSTPENKRAFLAGVDFSDITRYYQENKEQMDDNHEQLDIKIMTMLLVTLELAIGKDLPQLSMIQSYDKDKRIIIFLPTPEPKDTGILEEKYRAEATALAAA